MTPTRPVMRYHGGKWKLAPWLIGFFPAHRVYVEPYGGGGSVLIRKAPAYAEVYNDLDSEVVNLFRTLRDRGDELRTKIALTPFAREEYRASYEVSTDPMEQARRTMVRSFMGFGSNSLNRSIQSGFRSNSNRSGTTPARDWSNYPNAIESLIERLRGVVIENRDACEVMLCHDSATTVHYVDPPYVHETRMTATAHGAHGYKFEMTDADHERMAETLRELSGMVVLSGYGCPMYDRLFGDWTRFERRALADGALERTEVVWINPACAEALERDRAQAPLFAEGVE